MKDDRKVAFRVEHDEDWQGLRQQWSIRSDTIYLNHGSFGPPPADVEDCQQRWQFQLNRQPMDFFYRQYEPAWFQSRREVARFIGTLAKNITLVENATAAMNVVAKTVSLSDRDEVILTDHEYGAVLRIWQRACQFAGGRKPRIARLPPVIESADQMVNAIFDLANENTRLIVVSHVTSPTAIILPVHEICQEARRRDIAVCVDGPHAPAQVPLSLATLDCDFYTASLHKWVSAPFGSGFLFVSPRWHDRVQPPIVGWGRLSPNNPTSWSEEFIWSGTRDPSAHLACGSAIRFLNDLGLDLFRARSHYLARYARCQLSDLTGLAPQTPDNQQWYGSMASVPLPPGDSVELQRRLWYENGIEVPVIQHNGRRSIRVSCHLYNTSAQIDTLVKCLRKHLL